MAIFDSW